MSSSPERSRGDRWAEKLRASGCWVQKLPSSSMAGLPDWTVGKIKTDIHQLGPRFVEAKAALSGTKPSSKVYDPEQVTAAQWFFLDRWSQSGGDASVLILAEDGWIEMSIGSAHRPMLRREFDVIKRSYDI